MKICRTCCMPDTKPDLHFDKSGQCSACRNYAKRPDIDWVSRKKHLEILLDKHHGEVLVPSSGGKDSHYQALKLKEMGAHVTAVTATTCHLTPIGRANIDNLARHVDTIEVTPDRTVRAKLNKLGLELVGDISWPEHVAIFTTPFDMSIKLGIPLIMYGENPQNQYGGPPGSEEAMQMTRRWVSEYGGFLGLRPQDMVGQDGITEVDMKPYLAPDAAILQAIGCEAHFLGQYIPWDSLRNAEHAIKHGMKYAKPSKASWWVAENLDNAQTGLHDYMMWLKYGYGRGCAQISVDVRRGFISREKALEWVYEHDGIFPDSYADVSIDAVLDRIGMTQKELYAILDQYEAPLCSRNA